MTTTPTPAGPSGALEEPGAGGLPAAVMEGAGAGAPPAGDALTSPAPGRRLLRWLPWLLLLAALVVALVVGTSGSSGPVSLDQRVIGVASGIKCPVCQGESAASSQSPPAQEIRAIIRQRLQAGQSPATIRAYFVKAYGPSILLRPQASGIGILVWVLPVIAFLLAAAALAAVFARWRRIAGRQVTEADRLIVGGALEQ